jgi:hypothetical protein
MSERNSIVGVNIQKVELRENQIESLVLCCVEKKINGLLQGRARFSNFVLSSEINPPRVPNRVGL